MTTGYAPGKVILFGEHAVVYGRPAIAVPVTQVQAQATVTAAPHVTGITLIAQDLGTSYALADAPADDPLRAIVESTLGYLGLRSPPALILTVQSSIPIARGLGSGAAISTAIVRALARHFDRPIGAAEVSALVYQVEKLHHGTPSGIDNSVIAFQQPVFFTRGQPLEFLRIKVPFTLAIADTGVASPTKITVGEVRRAWQARPEWYESLFDQIGDIVRNARRAIESGDIAAIGPLMNANHELLQTIDVSSPELDRLVETARGAGALGAKLCGAGRGGNMVALVSEDTAPQVQNALCDAGAQGVIITRVG
jgi:mevalonate kinase